MLRAIRNNGVWKREGVASVGEVAQLMGIQRW